MVRKAIGGQGQTRSWYTGGMEIWAMLAVISLGLWLTRTLRAILMRLTILDLRLRALERFVASPDQIQATYRTVYNDLFGELYVGDYDALVKFSRKHKLWLPLKTSAEESADRARTGPIH